MLPRYSSSCIIFLESPVDFNHQVLIKYVSNFIASFGNDPGAVGLQLTGQWLVADPTSPQSVSASPGATWTVF